MTDYTLFLVEDDKAIINLMSATFDTVGYNYRIASTAKAALMGILSEKIDVIILDLGLPDMDGIELIPKIRSWSQVPIIIVSARSDDKGKICALDAGADDYLTKPFSTDELLARIRVALRRTQALHTPLDTTTYTFTNGPLTIDFLSHCVSLGTTEIHLTPNEYKLLCLLAKHTGKVLTHNFIQKEIWGTTCASDTQSLRVFMATLRKKLEHIPDAPKFIQTHVGIGYRMLRIDD
ncbi:MAG: response regulator [Cellulosilyticaceae bacterium]